MIIDYTYIHNKKCELIKHIELRGIAVSEQIEHDIHSYLQDIAYHTVGQLSPDRREG
jgi:hypothetical protein